MLSKQYRLTREKDFRRIFREGYSFFSNGLILRTTRNNLPISRFGIIVSVKVAKKAVIRNQLKRRLRALIKLTLIRVKPGFDCLFITRPAIVDKEYQEIKEGVSFLLKKARLLAPD